MQDEGTSEAERPQVMNLHHKDTRDITTYNTYSHTVLMWSLHTDNLHYV